MDSDEDSMHDFYSGEMDDGNDDVYESESEDTISKRQQNYAVLSEADLRQRQEEDITQVSTVLSVPRVSASILLRHYNWSVTEVQDAWFADEEKACETIGLKDKPIDQPPTPTRTLELTCEICFETYGHDMMNAAACGHLFCSSCWTGYITTSINDGPGCLMLRCPDPACRAIVGQDMINLLTSDEDKKKYSNYLLRSYVEDNRNIKWCPAPGCENAVDFVVGCGNYDVSCNCTYIFCWNCSEEAHRPVDCETVAKWILKNSSDAENVNWLLANSKPCPKCKRPIEKNMGCMHMTCTPPCSFHFCWLCLESWSKHSATQGFQTCNGFKTSEEGGVYDEAEKRRQMAKKSIERYTHHYERWSANHSSRQKAIGDLQEMQSGQIEKLSKKQNLPETQFTFITEAWLQIIECRRVLKWTYAYGYYLPEHENAKRQLFEYLQGEAESGLERLHQCAERELQVFLNAERPSKEELQVFLNAEGSSKRFNDFRAKLAGLTRVTQNYFENLVRALENGLSEVDSHDARSRTESSKRMHGPGGSISREHESSWSCQYCSFINFNYANVCEMCEEHR